MKKKQDIYFQLPKKFRQQTQTLNIKINDKVIKQNKKILEDKIKEYDLIEKKLMIRNNQFQIHKIKRIGQFQALKQI